MKRIVLPMLFCLLLIGNGFAQSVKSINLKDYKLSNKNEAVFLAECEASTDDEKTYHDGQTLLNVSELEIYILGWSNDGKLAYLENRTLDGRGGQDLYFTILDTNEDSKVYSHSFEYYDEDDDCSAEQCLKKNAQMIDAQLQTHAIVLQKTNYQAFPAKINNEEFSCKVNILKKTIPEWGFGQNLSYDIVAIKKGIGQKNISKIREISCNKVVVTGYLKSPYENRIAVIAIHSAHAYEGSEIYASFYGCNLEKGFK